MQTTYMTPQALGVALRQSAVLCTIGSRIRVASYAQPTPYAGSWGAVRFNWSEDPDRIATYNPRGTDQGVA